MIELGAELFPALEDPLELVAQRGFAHLSSVKLLTLLGRRLIVRVLLEQLGLLRSWCRDGHRNQSSGGPLILSARLAGAVVAGSGAALLLLIRVVSEPKVNVGLLE